jgi:hypothetical protein
MALRPTLADGLPLSWNLESLHSWEKSQDGDLEGYSKFRLCF